jgi:hypothetical protein
MSAITDYFERAHRKEYLNPTSHWFTIAGGILFLFVGAIAEIRNHDHSRALSYVAIGLGVTLFGNTHTRLRNSPWHTPAVLAELALWFGGAYWLIHTMF